MQSVWAISAGGTGTKPWGKGGQRITESCLIHGIYPGACSQANGADKKWHMHKYLISCRSPKGTCQSLALWQQILLSAFVCEHVYPAMQVTDSGDGGSIHHP